MLELDARGRDVADRSISGGVIYNYRYFLPHPPRWGTPAFCEQRLEELLAFCQRAGVGAVQFYVNTLEGTYYMPARSAQEQEPQAQWMAQRVAPAVRAIGVSYQLNFQMLLGAQTYGEDMRSFYDWELIVDSRGRDAWGVACPLGPRFRERMGAMLRLWAATGPDVLWIDDDFRLHNHGRADSGMDYYCYCDRHLAGFAEETGRRWERQELLDAILTPGPPSPVRRQWLAYLGRTMTDTAAWIREQVAAVSPQTRIALMTSAPEVHAVEGRDWRSLLGALSGPHRPMTRPCSGCYTGTTVPLKNQTCTYALMAKSMAILDHVLGRGQVEYAPELENTRFTTWAKSVVNTHYVLMLGQLLGTPHITLSINDLEGSAIEEEPTTAPLLISIRPRLEALAAMGLGEWEPAGATMLVDPHSAAKIPLREGQGLHDLAAQRPWEDLILQAGVPARFAVPQSPLDADSVLVLDEHAAWCLTDDELTQALRGAVLLDADAAWALQQRGFGEHVGPQVGQYATAAAMAESYEDDALPGVYAVRVPLRSMRWRELAVPQSGSSPVTVASWFIDGFNRRHVGSTLFENSLGGRVGVFACVGEMRYGTFFSHARLRWLRGMLRWLSRGRFAVIPHNTQHGLTIVRRRQDRWIIAYASLGTDPVTELKLELALPMESGAALAGSRRWAVEELSEDGRWRSIEPDATPQGPCTLMRVPCNLHAFQWWVGVLSPR